MNNYENLKNLYENIFNGLSGYGVSLSEKNKKQQEKYFKNLIYGELPFELLYALFNVEPMATYLKNAKNFYDLGSGIGNTVIGTYLIDNSKQYVGVEFLDSLYDISLEAKNKLEKLSNKSINNINFIHENILNVDLAKAESVLFCCPNTDENILLEMEEKFKKELQNGCFFMSIIYKFKDEKRFKLIDKRMVKTAWGETPLFVYEVCYF